MSTLDDFFGPAFDEVEQECKCLECRNKSSKQGGGHWIAMSQLWICDECWPQYEERQNEKQSQVQAAKARIESGNFSNADLNIVVAAGLAYYVYNDPESNRPSGIEWITPGNPYADQVDY